MLQGEDEEDDGTQVTYESGDLYNPAATFCEPRLMSKVEARHPLKPQPFVVLETPFAGNFRLAFFVQNPVATNICQAFIRDMSVAECHWRCSLDKLNKLHFICTLWLKRLVVLLGYCLGFICCVLNFCCPYFWSPVEADSYRPASLVTCQEGHTPSPSLSFPLPLFRPQRSTLGDLAFQWLRHLRGTVCRRLSGMHRRWRRSVASWRLYFSSRRLTMTRRS